MVKISIQGFFLIPNNFNTICLQLLNLNLSLDVLCERICRLEEEIYRNEYVAKMLKGEKCQFSVINLVSCASKQHIIYCYPSY